MSQLVPPRFLFRWSFSVRKVVGVPHRSGRLLDLPESCRIPSLGELDSTPGFADVRLAWNDSGLGLSVDVRGRTRRLKCSSDNPSVSDGLHVWIDTRNTQTVHRATKFCHQFSLLPSGGGRTEADPLAISIPLARAREETLLADTSLIQMQSEVRPEGYWLDAWLPAEALVGFDPSQHPQLGFHYVVRDSELGEQTLAVGSEFPYASDPSLWQTIELIDG
ncbi:MAG: hypothetical protein AABP62_19165 [Planctomycetota bacterium]